jgi:hypothetical protein
VNSGVSLEYGVLGGQEGVLTAASFGKRPNVVPPVFLTGRAALDTFGASGLAPHLGQATTFRLRS